MAGSTCNLVWWAPSAPETTGMDEHQSLHMPWVSLASGFTLLDKSLSPGETAVKITFEEEDKFRRQLLGTQQAQPLSPQKMSLWASSEVNKEKQTHELH